MSLIALYDGSRQRLMLLPLDQIELADVNVDIRKVVADLGYQHDAFIAADDVVVHRDH